VGNEKSTWLSASKNVPETAIQVKEVALALLIYIMGPSGSGKDSLMAEARLRLPAEAPVVFAHRYITRPADAGGENHVALNRAEFELRLANGLFALSWESHGFAYGIGREIDLWMEAGLSVVVNGSRGAMSAALKAYPELLPVLIDVPEHILRERLSARGREDGGEIEARLVRARMAVVETPELVRFDNSGPLSERGQALARLIRETALSGRKS
jgi:ribose 1,5-bisphosphokinase